MKDISKVLGKVALLYGLMALDIPFYCDIVPDVFPFRMLSRIYLVLISCVMITHYRKRISDRGLIKWILNAISALVFSLILLQIFKWSSFKRVETAERFTWYLFYIPNLFIPVLTFYLGLSLDKRERNGKHLFKRWGWMLVVSAVLVIIILTNDLHQAIFAFNPGFENWDTEYSHTPLFFAAYIWMYGLLAVSLAVILKKCRIPGARRRSWVMLISGTVGFVMMILLIIDKVPKINGMAIFSVTEAMILIVFGPLECCLDLGLIPSNDLYFGVLEKLSLPVHITDERGNVVYASECAGVFTGDMMSIQDKGMKGENTILRVVKLPGGYAFWQNDVSWLNHLNEELDDARSRLAEESEFIRLRNELDEKRAVIDRRSEIYDEIGRRTRAQSEEIARLTQEAIASDDVQLKTRNIKVISFYGTFIKRYSNLMLYESETGSISTDEVGLALNESLYYLSNLGIASEYAGINNASGTHLRKNTALALYTAFHKAVSQNLDSLSGCYAGFTLDPEERVQMRLTLDGTNIRSDTADEKSLADVCVDVNTIIEDSNAYMRFTVCKEGAEK